jgi:hypothetical protein
MEKVSIVCLIYKSISYCDFLYANIHKYTPEIERGNVEFYFVANDATEEILFHLNEMKYNHYINNNVKISETELFNMGYAYPEYITRVYKGYNFGIKMAKNPIVVLINSDNAFSENWLENLLNKLNNNVVVSSRMIQPHNKFPNPKNNTLCEQYDFGKTLKEFNENTFINKVNELKTKTTSIGNAFMPLTLYKKQAELVGYYPEGNLNNGSYNEISITGDHAFINKLEKNNISHITSNDSIVYHFQEGEKYEK